MSRSPLLLVLLLGLAGCVGAPVSSTPSATTAPSPSPGPGTASPTPAADPVRVHYVLQAGGDALSDFRSVNVTIRSVAFREGTGSQCHGRLYPDDLTITPTQTPDPDDGIDCVVFASNRTLDLTEYAEPTSMGAYTVPAVVADDTFLVVTPHDGTLENGTRVQFGEDDPGFAAVPSRDGAVATVGLSVRESHSGYGVADGAMVDGSAEPSAEYAVAVEGRIAIGNEVTISVTRDGEPATNVPVAVTGREFEVSVRATATAEG